MNILNICENPDVLEVFRIIKIVILIIKIVVPIILIVSLVLNYTSAVKSNDSDALNKANKSVIPKLVSAALVFFVPTFIDLIADMTDNDKGYATCLTSATPEGIEKARYSQIEVLVNHAKETLLLSDYNIALSQINSLKDESLKQQLKGSISTIKGYIDLKDEINELKAYYDNDTYNELHSKINSINDNNVKSKLLKMLESVKDNSFTQEKGVHQKTFKSSTGRTVTYYIGVPDNVTVNMPLIVYLHGDGSVGNPGNLESGEMAAYVKSIYKNKAPFIYIQPYTEIQSWTDGDRPASVIELIKNVIKEYNINPNKVSLSGGSRGAMGAWHIANNYSSMFSAFMPISGTGNINASNFKKLPTRAFSSSDSTDSWNRDNMKSNCDAINNAGGNCAFSSLRGYNHSTILTGVFTKSNFEWLIAQKR